MSAEINTIRMGSDPALSSKESQKAVFPGVEWSSWLHPDEVGFSNTVSGDLTEILRSIDTTSMIVVVGGKVLYSYGDPSEISYTASVRKSILAMLFGKYVDKGTIDIHSTLKKLGVSDTGGLKPVEETATICHLIMAKSGVYHIASNAGDDTSSAPERGSIKPGTHFRYNNWDFNAAGAIFERLVKKDIHDALEEDLAKPTQMQDYKRGLQRKVGDMTKSIYPAYYMWLSTQDMARLGYLMLRKGNWDGQQLIPKKWIETITTPSTKFEDIESEKIQQEGMFGFGYMWWIWRSDESRSWLEGAYTARGAFGQYISVFPKLDVVVAHKTSVNSEAKDAWDKYMADHKQECPKRNGVPMSQYIQVIDTLFKNYQGW